MGIKDNFSQAVKELWKKDGQDKKEESSPSQPSELDQYLRQDPAQTADNAAAEPTAETPYYREENTADTAAAAPSRSDAAAQNTQAPQAAQNTQETQSVQNPQNTQSNPQNGMNGAAQNTAPRQEAVNMNVQNIRQSYAGNEQTGARGGQSGGDYGYGGYGSGGFGGGYNPPPAGGMAVSQPQNESNELTVISKNTIIDGNVRSLANMQIDGNIKGNVETTKNIDMTGKVVGDVNCNNASMTSAAMQGNISLKGRMKMDRDTILIGDLSSQYADINGRIRGKLDIVGKAELKRDAIVFGDINASTIAVTDGAIIQGYVNTTFLSKEDSRNVFPEAISFDNGDSRSNTNNGNPNT